MSWATDVCDRCGRRRYVGRRNLGRDEHVDGYPCRAAVEGGTVWYHHDYYGCDTGCCGHTLLIVNAQRIEKHTMFRFSHDHREEAVMTQLVASHGVRIDRERCCGVPGDTKCSVTCAI